jgi:hypothetical protein
LVNENGAPEEIRTPDPQIYLRCQQRAWQRSRELLNLEGAKHGESQEFEAPPSWRAQFPHFVGELFGHVGALRWDNDAKDWV